MKTSKGFTIIELLVVIAIIAVLAAIVLVNVTQYLAKSRDAAIKGNMATVLNNSAVFFDTNNTYTGFDASQLYSAPATAITNAYATANPTIVLTTDRFCAKATLTDGSTTFCIDSTGYKGGLGSGKCVGGATPVYTCQ